MAASLSQRKLAEERRQKVWDMYCKGVNQYKIAEALGISIGRVSQLVKQAAAEHPIVGMDYNERAALSEMKWQESEAAIKTEIARQLEEGREVVEVIKFSDGSVQQKITRQKGVDPALLRCWSTHHDRHTRQLQNQISPDSSTQQVQVNVLSDFLKQGEDTKALTASDWNSSQQDPVVDV